MGPVIANAFLRKSGSPPFGIHLIVLLCLSLVATTYPLVVEIDPWHGHVVLGGSNRAGQIIALLDHRQVHPGAHLVSEIGTAGGPAILSIAERVMLSTIASFTSEAALVPAFIFPTLIIILALPAILLLLPEFKLASLPPPSPPPRTLEFA